MNKSVRNLRNDVEESMFSRKKRKNAFIWGVELALARELRVEKNSRFSFFVYSKCFNPIEGPSANFEIQNHKRGMISRLRALQASKSSIKE